MGFAWTLFVARRYFAAKRKEKSLASSFLSVAGIAVGVATLIVVIGVMNGFQLSFIEKIISIGSFHVRYETGAPKDSGYQTTSDIESIQGVQSVMPFFETEGIIQTGYSSKPIRIKAIPNDFRQRDPDFYDALGLTEGSSLSSQRSGGEAKDILAGAALALPGLMLSPIRRATDSYMRELEAMPSIIIGSELALQLGMHPGSILRLECITRDSDGILSTKEIEFVVSGTFKSGYLEYDSSLALVSLDLFPLSTLEGNNYFGKPYAYMYGIKLKDRYNAEDFIRNFETRFGAKNDEGEAREFVTWQQYSSAFFGALKMEKTMMILVIGLIFLVVSINIFHGLRRSVYERQEEIAVLRTMGASPRQIQGIFVFDGLLIGFIGASIGLLAGMFLGTHIDETLGVIEWVLSQILRYPVVLFSPANFYMTETPSVLLYNEMVIMFLFGAVSSIIAAFFASMRVSKVKPAEVLRNE